MLSVITGDVSKYKKEESSLLLGYLLTTKHVVALLDVQDEAYGNTPLHIACSMYSDTIVDLLLKSSKK